MSTIEIKPPTITEVRTPGLPGLCVTRACGLIGVGITLTTSTGGTSTGLIMIHGTPDATHQYGYGNTARVRVESVVGDQLLDSYTLDPNRPENDYDVVLDEVSQITGTTIKAVTDSIDGLTAIAVAYVSGGRAVWK